MKPFNVFKKEIENIGHVLLTEEKDYIGYKTRIKIMCPLKHQVETTINAIQSSVRTGGNGCRECGKERNKIPYEEVIKFLKEIGYSTDLKKADYMGISYTFPGKCNKGHDVTIKFHILKTEQGRCCKKCAIENAKVPYEDVINLVKEKGYFTDLKKEDYKGVTYRFPGKCSKGHDILIFVGGLREGSTCCIECAKDKRAVTNIENLGVPHPMQHPDIRKKAEETNEERRGVKCSFQSEEVKEKIKQTHMERRGVENPAQCEEVKQKMRETNIEIYGVPYPMQNLGVQKKKEETNIERYGFPHPSQNDEVKKKMMETNIERYGFPHALQVPEVREKIEATNIERYGFPCVLQNKEIREKGNQTKLERYGVICVMYNSDIRKKMEATNMERYGVPYYLYLDPKIVTNRNPFKLKSFIFPSGKETYCQGYEPFALKDLLKDGYSEDDILNKRSDMPKIYYTYDHVERRYFPDIYIPHDKKLIEVKSEYTFNLHKEVNLLKMKACLDLGFDYELRIYDIRGNYYLYTE